VTDRTLIIAHRGVALSAPENTIESFTGAIDAGADMIEFDVRRTRDGEMIAFHDAVAGGRPVGTLRRAEITAAAGAEPALFTDILELCAGRIGLDIELKEDGYVEEVMAAVRPFAGASQIIVTSFLPAAVARAKTLRPEIRTGLLLGTPRPHLRTRAREPHPVGLARSIGADYLAPHWALARRGVLKRAAAAGMPCLVWTVNAEREIRRFAADPRVLGVITDQAAKALRIRDEVGGRAAAS
jgi:glycerophosphoryl diester phosphodiesterase